MAFRMRRIDYYYATVNDEPDEACALLSRLAELGVNLLAFTAVPLGPRRTQFTLVPAEDSTLENAARNAGIALDGPHPALFAEGDDELGALAGVHARLHRANVDVFASSGIADGSGSFGYIVYVRPEAFQRAVQALEL